jgi:fructose-specific phosphotransferase system IIC component
MLDNETLVRNIGYFMEFIGKVLPGVIAVYVAFWIYNWKKN